MTTAKQMAANRRNSERSTGPKTAEGKSAVSQNRLEHGFRGAFRVLACENQARFDELLADFIRDEQPVGSVEHALVIKMARHTWMADRAVRFQNACFRIHAQTTEQKGIGAYGISRIADVELYIRYQIQQDRAYQRAYQALLQRRKERLQAEIGFERQKQAEAAAQHREAQEVRRQQAHHTAEAIRNETLIQKKLRTILLERQVSPSQPDNKSANNLNPEPSLSAAA